MRELEAYLDNAATTRAHPEVVRAVVAAMSETYGNPSSPHARGAEAERVVKAAREAVARLLDAKPAEIVFTSGGTEAINTALKGAVAAARGGARHVVTTAVEHPATLATCRQLQEDGVEVTIVPVDASGVVDPRAVAGALRPDTVCVSVMWVNNEVGSIQPLADVAAALRAHRRATGAPALFHVDAVQAVGRMPVRPREVGADLLSLSAHKFHGPKGVGALWIREGVRIRPLLAGGEHERGLRSGTENVPGIAGLGKAAELAAGWASRAQADLAPLKARLWEAVRDAAGDAEVNGPPPGDPRAAAHILNVSLPGLRGEVAVHALAARGVYVSTGSACSTRKPDPSHVLQAMGFSSERIQGALRFSLSPLTGAEAVEHAARALGEVVPALRAFVRR